METISYMVQNDNYTNRRNDLTFEGDPNPVVNKLKDKGHGLHNGLVFLESHLRTYLRCPKIQFRTG